MLKSLTVGPLLRALLILICTGTSTYAQAEVRIPHVDQRAIENFALYEAAEPHRAFAIAPGGAWSWRSGEASPDAARQAAIDDCAEHTQQKCVAYAIDDQIVFNSANWERLWGPYPDRQIAPSLSHGVKVGQRLPDLAFMSAKGKPLKLSHLKGKVVLVHFWGSWCPPCMKEFPSLKQLHTSLQKQLAEDVVMVMLQVREPFTQSLHWAQKNRFGDLPLYDSGSVDGSEDLQLADGTTLPDRLFARVFPSSYVIDRHGTIVFAHRGPIDDWSEYLPFFKDAANRSGK